MSTEHEQARLPMRPPTQEERQRDEIAGATRLDRDLTDAERQWGITADELDRRHKKSPSATKPRERMCIECGRRVTISPGGDVEYGHSKGRKAPKCSHYPEGLDEKKPLDEF